MTLHRSLIPILLATALVACRSDSAVRAASLDQEIELAPKQQAVFAQQELQVEFVRVVQDSRCPTDVTCVWAGEVEVEVSTRRDASEAVPHFIKAGEHAAVGGLRVTVVRVRPERVSTREISPEQYRVTLKVER
ncbi:hypothetical protein JM946_00695 [Steroidobacter sp. S1-65]|uniref:Lipoprotein n=1 Tax=Steroidobacter gossypii TaxID=2805490 RepID=A0ABS1WQL1_9GAMM|nr:hypothetical protein [Steroidobacter gossypii]MBM0103237.1 hypothetical protein [Steroidobacter gossypii]